MLTAANSSSVSPSADHAPMADSFLISPVRFWPQYWLPSTIMPLLMPYTSCCSTNWIWFTAATPDSALSL